MSLASISKAAHAAHPEFSAKQVDVITAQAYASTVQDVKALSYDIGRTGFYGGVAGFALSASPVGGAAAGLFWLASAATEVGLNIAVKRDKNHQISGHHFKEDAPASWFEGSVRAEMDARFAKMIKPRGLAQPAQT